MPNVKISHLDMTIISKYQEEGFTNLEICKKLNISEYLLYKFFLNDKNKLSRHRIIGQDAILSRWKYGIILRWCDK